jgi:hypothetical protein
MYPRVFKVLFNALKAVGAGGEFLMAEGWDELARFYCKGIASSQNDGCLSSILKLAESLGGFDREF